MKIAIRADGGSQIGMGHIMRTLVLAKELSKINSVFYICRIDEDDSYRDSSQIIPNSVQAPVEELVILSKSLFHKYKKGIEKVISEGFKVLLVRENYLLQDLKSVNADLLITDSYDVDEEYFNKTKVMFNKTAYIDDMNLYYFNVDFLINQNVDAEDFNYKVNKDTKLMFGSKYIMLRKEFRNLPPKKIKQEVCDIMLTVGGSDPYHVTKKILSWIGDLDYCFHVVVGPSFDYGESLKNLQSDKIKLYFNADMCELMQSCDIAVSACGSTLYELAACGVPTLGIIIADNQRGIGNKLNNMEIINNLGWYNKISKKTFIKAINELAENYNQRKTMSEKASSIVDGKGVQRISKLLMLT